MRLDSRNGKALDRACSEGEEEIDQSEFDKEIRT